MAITFPPSQGSGLTPVLLDWAGKNLEEIAARNGRNAQLSKQDDQPRESTLGLHVKARALVVASVFTAAIEAAVFHTLCTAVKLVTAPFGHAAKKLGCVKELSENFGFKEAGRHLGRSAALALYTIPAVVVSVLSLVGLNPSRAIDLARALTIIPQNPVGAPPAGAVDGDGDAGTPAVDPVAGAAS